jgi:hypothetical protein
MTHLSTINSSDELEKKITQMRKKKIYYKIKIREGLIIELDTEDKTLIEYAKSNNPELS